MLFANRFQKLAHQLDELGSDIDEQWKIEERKQIDAQESSTDEQHLQHLAALSRIVWEAHRVILQQALGAARAVDKVSSA